MIRRESTAPDAPGAQWVLISQIDHAHLAGRLAEHWGAGSVAPLVAPTELGWAITHHDDGWREWEASPDVEPTFARPRSFTEMELTVGLEIWGSSITQAAEYGPLAGYVVAGHFCALLRRFDFGWKDDQRHTADARRFLAKYESLMDGCWKAWQARLPAEHTRARAQIALAQLQFFDALSLWFCCDEAMSPDDFECPSGPVVTLTPLDRGATDGSIRLALSPWPFAVASLNLEVPGRAVPVRRYQTRAQLAAVPAQNVKLRWTLEPLARS